MQLRRPIGILFVALAIGAALAFGFLPRPVPVDLVTVTRAPLAVTVEDEGRTRVIERYVVSAPMTGYLRRINLHVGDAIRVGQVLAAIEPSRATALDPRSLAQASAQEKAAVAALAGARATAAAAGAQADLARQELERSRTLRDSNFISEQGLDRARSEATRSQATRLAADQAANVARFELDVARAALARTAGQPARGIADLLEIRAPVDGEVLKLARDSEGAVQAGQPLIEVGNAQTLEVEVELLSTQAVRLAPGAKVLIDRWGGDGVLEGVVQRIEPTGFTKVSALGVEEQRVRVIVDFVSPREQWRRLGDGYRVEARFVVWEGIDVLQIPASALFRHQNGWAVFVAEAGRAMRVPVEIGQRAGLVVQVRSGLAAGQTIIDHPDDRIGDRVRIKPRAS